MKTILSETFTFITPAFACGANQSRAELRPASVRGQLRWWFRVLGGSPEIEADVFGGVHGGTSASSVVVRVADVKPVHEEFQKPAPMSDLGYLLYFATVSGERQGMRIERDAYFAPGTSYRLEISLRKPLSDEAETLLGKAVECFAMLGSLGLRATRGCGAFSREAPRGQDDFVAWCRALPHVVLAKPVSDRPLPSAKAALSSLGGWLRGFRHDNHLSSKHESALGFSIGKNREASALRLRPVQVREGYLPVLVYTDAACSQRSIINLL